jgi:hypothetical protein
MVSLYMEREDRIEIRVGLRFESSGLLALKTEDAATSHGIWTDSRVCKKARK